MLTASGHFHEVSQGAANRIQVALRLRYNDHIFGTNFCCPVEPLRRQCCDSNFQAKASPGHSKLEPRCGMQQLRGQLAAQQRQHRLPPPRWTGAGARQRHLTCTVAAALPPPEPTGDDAAADFHASALPRLRKTARLEPSFALSQEDAVVAQLKALQVGLASTAVEVEACRQLTGGARGSTGGEDG